MANNPVIGIAVCPFCGGKNVVVWDGNFKFQCHYCHRTFKVKRQKLRNVKAIKKGRVNYE